MMLNHPVKVIILIYESYLAHTLSRSKLHEGTRLHPKVRITSTETSQNQKWDSHQADHSLTKKAYSHIPFTHGPILPLIKPKACVQTPEDKAGICSLSSFHYNYTNEVSLMLFPIAFFKGVLDYWKPRV